MLAVLSGETRGKVEVCKGWLGGDGWWKQFQMKTIVIDSMYKSFCTHFSDTFSAGNPHWFSPEIGQIFHDKYLNNKKHCPSWNLTNILSLIMTWRPRKWDFKELKSKKLISWGNRPRTPLKACNLCKGGLSREGLQKQFQQTIVTACSWPLVIQFLVYC